MTDAERDEYQTMTFEQLVATLEEITERMASGQIGIEEAADLYEQAERLHGLAAERLARVQARIEAQAAGHGQAGIEAQAAGRGEVGVEAQAAGHGEARILSSD